jgi:hypothetical protein
MKPSVGSTVKRHDRPSEHRLVREGGTTNVIVDWHLKQATSLGPAGMPTGKVYEDPAMLMPDTPCPHCKAS